VAGPGRPEEIGYMFAGFQKYPYQQWARCQSGARPRRAWYFIGRARGMEFPPLRRAGIPRVAGKAGMLYDLYNAHAAGVGRGERPG
jgi:hypothetical protein